MWTKYAIEHNFVIEREIGFFYFDNMRNGDYFATGRDINDRPIRRGYEVNDRIDRKSPWSMWNDFNGRWGLTRIWYIEPAKPGQIRPRRRLIWSN